MFLKYSRLVMLTNSVVLTYCIFFVDWGPHEHVFSGVLILLSLHELTQDSFYPPDSLSDGFNAKRKRFGQFLRKNRRVMANRRNLR